MPPSDHDNSAPDNVVTRSDLLASIPLFASLTPDDRDWTAERCVLRDIPDGVEVAIEGESGDSLWVVLSGMLRASGRAGLSSVIQVRFSEIGPGVVFVDSALLDDEPSSATLTAIDDTRCLILPAAACRELMHRSNPFAIALLREQSVRLRQTERQLAREALDPLTGLATRRTLDYSYRRVAAGARRRSAGLTILLVRLENVDQIVQAGGYLAGDEALLHLAEVLSECARSADLIGRWGNEKFVMILADAVADAREVVTARILQLLQDLGPNEGVPLPLVVRFGAAWSDQPPDRLETLVVQADQDLARVSAD